MLLQRCFNSLISHCPYPPASDLGSRVSGLVVVVVVVVVVIVVVHHHISINTTNETISNGWVDLLLLYVYQTTHL